MPLRWTALSFEPLLSLTEQYLLWDSSSMAEGETGGRSRWVVVWESWAVVRVVSGKETQIREVELQNHNHKFIVHCSDWDIFSSKQSTNNWRTNPPDLHTELTYLHMTKLHVKELTQERERLVSVDLNTPTTNRMLLYALCLTLTQQFWKGEEEIRRDMFP